MRTRLTWLAVAAGALVACGGGETSGSGGGGAAGAGGSSAVVCGDHPLSCPAGQTCWFAGDGTFTCQASGAGKAGEACAPSVGQPTCADGLLCVRATGMDGVCTALCDPTSSDEVCLGATCILVQTPDSGDTHVCH